MPDNRARYVATVIQAFILGAVTYYGVKWLMDAMDPTKKNRLAAQKQVMIVHLNAFDSEFVFHLLMARFHVDCIILGIISSEFMHVG